MRTIRLSASKEEKVAAVIGKAISDFSLDLEAVGFHLAHSQPHVVYSRAIEVLESAEYNKDAVEYNTRLKYYPNKPAVDLENL